jgi:type II secretory pathway component PulF
MPFYSYTALDDNGAIVKGEIQGEDVEFACNGISSSGLHLVKIRQLSRLSESIIKTKRARGVKRSEIIELSSNLSVMVKAGLPLNTAIMDIAETIENKVFRMRIQEMARNIELGASFSTALSHHSDIFPDIFINLVTIGEETGSLDISLADIAVHLQRMEDLKSAIIRALMYPVFALVGTIAALLFWLIYVLPKMTDLFTDMSLTLPPITIGLIMASDFSISYWYVYIVVPFLLFGTYKILCMNEKTKYFVDAAKLKMPLVKLIVYNKMLALFAEQLRILFSAGVTIDKSFDIMATVMNNSVFKKAIVAIKEDIILGSKITDAVQRHDRIFPKMVFRMLSIGETTGNLGEQLDYLAEYYLKKLDDISVKMGKLIEPIIIIFIGGIFMVIILGLIAPIYDLISGVGG